MTQALSTGLLILGLTTALAAQAAQPKPSDPRIRCELHYGGEVFTVESSPTSDPYRVPVHELGSYFLFKLVWHDDNTASARRQHAVGGTVHTYTYAHLDRGPTLVHQHSASPAALNGSAWHQVHDQDGNGELLYRCGLRAAGTRSPSGPAWPTAPAPPQIAADPTPVHTQRIRLPGQGPVKLVFVGDIMLDDGPGRTIANGGDPLAPFAAWLRAADVAIGNLETSIAAPNTGTAADSKFYTFRASPEVTRVLQGRFHALSVANNHSGDYGHPAFLETLQHLRTAGIQAVGGGIHLAQAHAPLWIERGNLKIAVLACNSFKPRAFEAGPHWPGVAWCEDEQMVSDIRAARRDGAHVVIPFLHWGWESQHAPNPRQHALAQRLLKAGADAIVGAHPHVTQGSNTISGKPVIWSLGNFVFDGFEDEPQARVGWLLDMDIDRHGVVRWKTVQARLDADGTPHPEPEAATPRGQRGQPGTAAR